MSIAYINDQPYEIAAGESLLAFLRRHLGEDAVPTLCQAPNLPALGACRVCSVLVKHGPGEKGRMQAACHQLVQPGSYLYPDAPEVLRLRKNIVELVLTDYPVDFDACSPDSPNELERLVARLGIREPRYPAGATHTGQVGDDSHPYMRSDLSKCIHCHRCIAACDAVQGQFVLSNYGRGFESRIIKGADTSFADSPCVSCGACAEACPTGAITDIYNSRVSKGERQVRTTCTYCGVGCQLEVSLQGDEVLSIRAPYDAAVNHGHLCVKGRFAFRFYRHPDRIQTPLIRRNGSLEPATWEEAYDFIAGRLQEIRSKHGPDAIAGISSSRCTNEENYLMQKFIRAVVGTNNIDGCARICHAPTAAGMQRTFGTGAATNSIEDLDYTDCILMVGCNPTSAHPVTGARIRQRVLKGVPLIVVDPRRTELAKLATCHLALRPGSNVALLNLMLYYILQEDLVDWDFVLLRCEGFESLIKHIESLDPAELEAICGVNRQLVREAAILYASAPNAMSFHGLGVTEHSQGTFGVMLVAALAMLTGNIGRRGVGVNPLRGQNNVQGSADMGVQPNQGAGYLDVTDPVISQLYARHYGVEAMPRTVGYRIPEMLDAAREGKLKALWIMGEDVVQTEPHTEKVREALRQLDLLVVQELFLSETAQMATVVLPGASFLEKSGTFTNGERRVQRVNQALPPRGQAKADGQIVVDIMNRMGYGQPDYDPQELLKEIAGIVPFFKGITWENLGINGKQWPVSEDGTDTQVLHQESFGRGKGLLASIDFAESRELEENSDRFPFILTTNRALEHYNCGTMTRRTGNREILPSDELWIHPQDAKAKGIADGDWVKLSSARGSVRIQARVTPDVKPGVVSSTFHFPEIMINTVTSDVYDSEACCPEYKVVAVQVSRGE